MHYKQKPNFQTFQLFVQLSPTAPVRKLDFENHPLLMPDSSNVARSNAERNSWRDALPDYTLAGLPSSSKNFVLLRTLQLLPRYYFNFPLNNKLPTPTPRFWRPTLLPRIQICILPMIFWLSVCCIHFIQHVFTELPYSIYLPQFGGAESWQFSDLKPNKLLMHRPIKTYRITLDDAAWWE